MTYRWRGIDPGAGFDYDADRLDNNFQWRDAHVNRSQPPVCSGVRRAANLEKVK